MSESPDPPEEALDFEEALSELEALVESLEQGDLSLEASLEAFERGVTLTRTCQVALKQAEQKVEVLTREGGVEDLDDIDPDEDPAD